MSEVDSARLTHDLPRSGARKKFQISTIISKTIAWLTLKKALFNAGEIIMLKSQDILKLSENRGAKM